MLPQSWRQSLDGRRDGNGAHTEEMAMWDLLPIRSSLNVSEEQEEGRQSLIGRRDGNGAHTEEMSMRDLLPIRSSLKA